MTYKLFLDDERMAPDSTWTVAKSVAEAKTLIQNLGWPAAISFDYYLTGFDPEFRGVPTGLDFAQWLVDRARDGDPPPPGFKYGIHSASLGGGMRIQAAMSAIAGEPAAWGEGWWTKPEFAEAML
jgi:hypothetical protein